MNFKNGRQLTLDVSYHSIENQKLIIESWAEQQKTIISHFYVDDGFSGSNYERPAFQELLQDIKDEKVNCVVVKDLSRLGRNLVETGYYIEMFFSFHNFFIDNLFFNIVS